MFGYSSWLINMCANFACYLLAVSCTKNCFSIRNQLIDIQGGKQKVIGVNPPACSVTERTITVIRLDSFMWSQDCCATPSTTGTHEMCRQV